MKVLVLAELNQVSGGSGYDDDDYNDKHPDMPDHYDHKKCHIYKWQEVCYFDNDLPCVKM